LDKFETIFDVFNTKEKESNIKMKSTLEELKHIDIDTINNNIYDYKKNIKRYNKSLIKMGKMKSVYNMKRKKYMTKLNCNTDDINMNYTADHIPMLNEMIDMIDTIIDTNITIPNMKNNINLQYNKHIIDIPKEMIILEWKKQPIYSNDMVDISDCARYIYPLYVKYKEYTKIINDLDYKIELLEQQIKSNTININCDVCLNRKSKYDKLVAEYDGYNQQKNSIIMPNTDIIYNMVMEYGYDGENKMEDIYNYICIICSELMRMNDNNELFFNEFIKDITNHYRDIKEYTNVDINKLIIAKNKLIKNIQFIENNKILRLIDRIENKLETIENKMVEYNRELNKITYNLALEESRLKNYNDMNNNIVNYTTNHNIYNALKKATHINGIPSMIISSRLNDINTKVNDMIAPFIAKKVNVVLDGNNILVHILDNMGHIINILGGMEMFMINIAFKIALAGISILPKTKMLIIDEGVSVLDKSHIDKFNNIAQFLNSNYNHVILISHIDGLKDHITQFININKINGKSYINYI
jgi:DNA repair exonuclease SbcCD ATPase subunit